MIYLIFTQQGFEEAKNIILEDKATLWVNDGILSNENLAELTTTGISVHTLNDKIDPSDEKSVLVALKHVEQNSPNTEIFVEYL
ncbi:MAG: hypothetical protein DRQ35_02175 [Gammaproteobacteria bacterium]|nr:MAG: hypothetical protein DRQ35_02175 [Gammaproteobacteria bacterium]